MRYQHGVISQHDQDGLTFVGVIISAAIMLLIFGGLFSAFIAMIDVVSRQKAEAGAMALAKERLEYIRSLPYNDVGTLGGIVPGNLPQNSTTTLNSIVYNERILVLYIDDEADGTALGTGDAIPSDYKVVKVEYSWDHKGSTTNLALISNIVPPGQETTVGGGTLVVNVFDALIQPIDNAEVHIVNDTTTSTIDTTVYTNPDGRAVFPGAPAAANYQISATKAGFSTSQTYSATGTNSNPSPPHVAVVESGVSSISFSIDELSDLRIVTRINPVTASNTDTFADTSLVHTLSSTTVNGGALQLTGGPSTYAALGTGYATKTEPTSLNRWLSFDSTMNTPGGTSAIVQLFWVSSGGTYTLVTDVDVPGNSAGFTGGIVDISSLDPGTYPRLALGATLQTASSTLTPEILDWGITYETSATPVGGVTVDMHGNKTIGSTVTADPIYKMDISTTTDGTGVVDVTDVEWDVYNISIDGSSEGYDIAEACGDVPYALNPGVDEEVILTLEPHVTHSLRVMVEDVSGNPVPGADVRMQRSGFDETVTTSVCGQAFFNVGLGAFSDYLIEVSANGFTTENLTDVPVNGTTYLNVPIS